LDIWSGKGEVGAEMQQKGQQGRHEREEQLVCVSLKCGTRTRPGWAEMHPEKVCG